MTLGSLFDGSGGFPLAGAINGIMPLWASEIEPYPIAVTRARFPQMRHIGDVSKVKGSEIEPVDIITFGSPCQDMSVAGKRAGMKHAEHDAEETTRSGLFYEAVRIIREMREATNGRNPAFAVWENVPGAFSSNKGEDFRCVLEELCKVKGENVSVTRPADGKWLNAGEIMGNGFSVAWRILDAQFWGVPQRRKRIYLVADFDSECAGKILFEREGVRGNSEKSGAAREDASSDVERRAGGSGGVRCLTPWDYQSKRQYAIGGCYPAISARERSGQNQQGVCYAFHLQQDPITDPVKSPCIGSQHQACIGIAAFMGGQGSKAGSIAYSEDTSPTIKSALSGGNTVPDVVYPQIARTLEARHDSNPCVDRGQNVCVYALQGNGIDRADTAGCNGCGWREGQMYTLNTIDRPANHIPSCAYCYDCRGNGDGNVVPNLTGDHENRVTDYTACVCFDKKRHDQYGVAEKASALTAHNGKDFGDVCIQKRQRHYIVRRLTPTECARLQGFPDCWGCPDRKDSFTDEEAEFWEDMRKAYAEANGKTYRPMKPESLLKWYNGLHTDSAEYKMWGNGIALPCAEFVIRRIKEVHDERH